MEIPDKTSDYLSPEYWNERFKTEERKEWLGEYKHFASLIHRELGSSEAAAATTCLVVGNGNSLMGQSVAKDRNTVLSPESTIITDIAPVCVYKSREKEEEETTANCWAICDMLRLPFRENSVDLIIEKGAHDVLEVDAGKDPWNPNPETRVRVLRWLSEAHRVLTEDGMLISVSFQQPHFRKPLFDAAGYTWRVKHSPYTTETTNEEGEVQQQGFWEYFVYFAKKGQRDASRAYQQSSSDRGSGADADDDEGEGRGGCKKLDLEHEYMDEEDYLFRIGGDE